MGIPTTQFLKTCEYRGQLAEQGSKCGLLSDRLGIEVRIAPMQCARCVLNGSIDEEFLGQMLLREFAKTLELVKLGFYGDNGERYGEIRGLIEKAVAADFDKAALQNISGDLVAFQRITEEQGVELLEQVIYPEA